MVMMMMMLMMIMMIMMIMMVLMMIIGVKITVIARLDTNHTGSPLN